MTVLEERLRAHAFSSALPPEDLARLARCGCVERYAPGSFLAHEGEPGVALFLIWNGQIAVETQRPGRPPALLMTLGADDVAGWSWIVPPFRWTFDLRATKPTEVVSLDGRRLREACEADPALGYRLVKALAGVMTARLRATRMQLLDLYGVEAGP